MSRYALNILLSFDGRKQCLSDAKQARVHGDVTRFYDKQLDRSYSMFLSQVGCV